MGVCGGVWVCVGFGIGSRLPGLCVVGMCGGVWVCVLDLPMCPNNGQEMTPY